MHSPHRTKYSAAEATAMRGAALLYACQATELTFDPHPEFKTVEPSGTLVSPGLVHIANRTVTHRLVRAAVDTARSSAEPTSGISGADAQ
jgi:deoxyhypusine synthase